MSFRVSFRRAAKAEFLEAAKWYERQRAGLGQVFIAEIERCIALAAKDPLQFGVVEADIRHMVAKRFPYSIYFRVRQNMVVILAVFHGKRAPVNWQMRG